MDNLDDSRFKVWMVQGSFDHSSAGLQRLLFPMNSGVAAMLHCM